MLQTQYNIVAVLPQYNISTVQEINTCVSLTSNMAGSGMVCFYYHYSCDISIVQELSVLDYTSVYHAYLAETHMTKCRVSNYTENFVNLKISTLLM